MRKCTIRFFNRREEGKDGKKCGINGGWKSVSSSREFVSVVLRPKVRRLRERHGYQHDGTDISARP